MRLNANVVFLLPAIASSRRLGHTLTARDESPPPSSVKIRGVQTSGSGCPPGSVSIQISLDQTTVTIGMTKMSSYYGPEYKSSEALRNCEIHADLTYPGGYQYSVMSATYNGYARLDPGVVGHLTSSYFFSQNPTKIKYSRADIQGPEYEAGAPFQKRDSANDKTLILSPCGGNGILNVNDILSVTSRNRTLAGEMNVFDATISFQQQVYIKWQRCGTDESANNGESPESKAQSTGGKSSGAGAKSSDASQSGSRPGGGSSRTGVKSTGGRSQTFQPIIYTDDLGDLQRRPHAIEDLESTVTSFPS